MSIGERIQTERIKQSKSIQALARASGLTKGFISQVENGHSRPSLASLQRIAAALDVPVPLLLAPLDSLTLDSHSNLGVRVLHASDLLAGNHSIALLATEFRGSVALFSLEQGMRLQEQNQPRVPAPAWAICVVQEGVITFRQDERSLEITGGDVLSWANSAPYTIESRGHTPASLLLLVPTPRALPVVVAQETPVDRVVSIEPVALQKGMLGGPFRLVAMRAARSAVRPGRKLCW